MFFLVLKIIFMLIVLLLLLIYYFERKSISQVKNKNGEVMKSTSIFGLFLRLIGGNFNPVSLLDEGFNSNGDVYASSLFNIVSVNIRDPEIAKEVIKDSKSFNKVPANTVDIIDKNIMKILGPSLFFNNMQTLYQLMVMNGKNIEKL
jgi:hypothetical protein